MNPGLPYARQVPFSLCFVSGLWVLFFLPPLSLSSRILQHLPVSWGQTDGPRRSLFAG